MPKVHFQPPRQLFGRVLSPRVNARMVHLDHGPNPSQQLDNQATAARNARYGVWLFGLYLLLYGGFVAVSAFAPQWMEATPLAGINLAILYGMGLIVSAFLLALVYGWLCRLPVHEASQEQQDRP
jgi:uncharacterized membrane protein (DUF485 family)